MSVVQTLRFFLHAYPLKAVSRYSPRRLAALQRSRLRALVERAAARSPFYQAKYRGVDFGRLRLADLPPTNKQELMANFDRAVTDPGLHREEVERFLDDPANLGRRFRDHYVVSHTSGSQGQPIIIVQHCRLMDLLFGLQVTRGNAGQVSIAEGARRLLRPARLAIVTLKRGFYPSAVSFEYMPDAARRYVRVLRLSQTDADVIDRLNQYRPTVLTAYAGVLDHLAAEVERGRLRLAPELRQIVNNSEMLTDRARQRIQKAFGLHVMDNYATGECPFLSNGCPVGHGAHVNADWAILEVVDDNYRPVPPGTQGKKVLITNLANRIQPFIRYEVGDLVTMATQGDTPCQCGSRLPRIARIDGRSSDCFWVGNGTGYRKLLSSVFKQAFDHIREVREWQAVQTDRNRIRLKVELLPRATFDEERAWTVLNRQLEAYDFRGLVQVSLERVRALPPDPKTGKLKRIVSLVGTPADLGDRRECSGFPAGASKAPALAG